MTRSRPCLCAHTLNASTCNAIDRVKMLAAAINPITPNPRDPGTPSPPTDACFKPSQSQFKISPASRGKGSPTSDLRDGDDLRRRRYGFRDRPNALRAGSRALLLLLTLPLSKILWDFAALHDPTTPAILVKLDPIKALLPFCLRVTLLYLLL